MKKIIANFSIIVFLSSLSLFAADNYYNAKWNEIHFKPNIDKATNTDCLKCHQEIFDRKVRDTSIAGVKKSDALAWYQTLDTYKGEQETFHARHMNTEYAQKVMDLKCNTCHQGNDPREEAVGSHATQQMAQKTGDYSDFTLRKMVNPDICLKCHGQFNAEVMASGGLTGNWPDVRDDFGNDCLSCHAAFRTNRHQVNYLKADNIEKVATEEGGDVCYGCHGGRAWYRISYPYPRHPWPGMSEETPDWAKNRPTESEARFLKK
jgi:hypothetical protein